MGGSDLERLASDVDFDEPKLQDPQQVMQALWISLIGGNDKGVRVLPRDAVDPYLIKIPEPRSTMTRSMGQDRSQCGFLVVHDVP